MVRHPIQMSWESDADVLIYQLEDDGFTIEVLQLESNGKCDFDIIENAQPEDSFHESEGYNCLYEALRSARETLSRYRLARQTVEGLSPEQQADYAQLMADNPYYKYEHTIKFMKRQGFQWSGWEWKFTRKHA